MRLKERLSRLLIRTLMLQRPLSGSFHCDAGHCWMAYMPQLRPRADDVDTPFNSHMVLYEDGAPLRPAHANHDDIRNIGLGQYCHWRDWVMFSTSDNSNPNTNGRCYQYSLSPWLFRRHAAVYTRCAFNQSKRNTDPQEIRGDVIYTLQTIQCFLDALRQLFPSLQGKTVVELGPGHNYGAVMCLSAYGMRPVVADRFLAPWDPDYHPAFYTILRDELVQRDSHVDVGPLNALLEASGYPAEVIARYEAPLETIPVVDNSVDVVFSNAVLEHLYDLDVGFAQLYRITRPGGINLHQIDCRDHRNFSRPLEYLLLSEHQFQVEFTHHNGECGNRHRPDEVARRIRAAGFEVLGFEGNCFSEPDYLKEFLPRLRKASRSRYRKCTPEDLRILSGWYRLRKPM
ncbi:MAG: class I SAM-dependent methyltransferase [Gemmataceae bacterium]|nr:class I SAM-dependent methyltransferase [Gemmataceae bacterium]